MGKTFTIENGHSLRQWYYFAWLIPIVPALYLDLRLMFSIYGLPIDDAYIYVKYIRNIVSGAGYSFNSGETSFGVTSFLFTICCSIFQYVMPFIDTVRICQLSSVFSHMLLLWIAQRIVFGQTGNFVISLMAGGLLAFCFPLFFIAPSGLETLFFIASVLLTVWLGLREPSVGPVWLGVLSSVIYLSRPEGVYFAFTFLCFFWSYPFIFSNGRFRQYLKQTFKITILYLTGFSFFTLPYLLFVKIHSGGWMPMTYYGKLLNRNNYTLSPWYINIKEGVIALIKGYNETLLQDHTVFMLAAIILFAYFSSIAFAFRCGKTPPTPLRFAVRAAVFSFFLFPFIFGFAFRISPLFGGYCVRYILILTVLCHIEAFIVSHLILSRALAWIGNEQSREKAIRIASLVFIPLILYSATIVFKRLENDIAKYQRHVIVSESVRRPASEWINDHASKDARVFTSNTGLGAVGVYLDRYIKDEAGLINPDIHPYLQGFSQGFNHWHKMLEYMKEKEIDYVTVFPPYGEPIRHTQLVATIEEPRLKGTNFERIMTIDILRFTAPERYELWKEYPQNAVLVDRAYPPAQQVRPASEDRVRVTDWKEQPVVAIQTRSQEANIRQQMIFPTHARLTAGIAFDFPPRGYAQDEEIIVEVKVNYAKTLDTVFSQSFPLTNLEPRQIAGQIEIDLEPYSKKYAYLLYGVRISKPSLEGVWTGWVAPVLAAKN